MTTLIILFVLVFIKFWHITIYQEAQLKRGCEMNYIHLLLSLLLALLICSKVLMEIPRAMHMHSAHNHLEPLGGEMHEKMYPKS